MGSGLSTALVVCSNPIITGLGAISCIQIYSIYLQLLSFFYQTFFSSLSLTPRSPNIAFALRNCTSYKSSVFVITFYRC